MGPMEPFTIISTPFIEMPAAARSIAIDNDRTAMRRRADGIAGIAANVDQARHHIFAKAMRRCLR